ncbi:MAG: hypothetical protein JSV88_13050 [Candidatus Aminicenantes bacterium]|nr:MAG: hypothetical protein JSV88_13050 [Candidatus Aminicenantes bacterium]
MFKFGKKGSNDGRDYEKKSRRIYAWSDLLKSVSKFLWLIVILIVLAALGKMFVFKPGKESKTMKPVKKPVVDKIDWSQVNKKIEKMMTEARAETEELASAKLDQWIEKNMERVDNDFLNWYFSYWTQQKLGLQSLLAQVWHWVDSDSPTAAEKITQEVQEEFTNRVIRPQIAQMEIERLINEIVSYYSGTLKGKLERIPREYNINPADWDRYIADISVMVKNVEAGRSTSLPLKALVGLTAGGVIVMANSLRPIIAKIGAKISSKLAAKSAAKMAAKTGGKVAVKTGGKFLGTIIAVGIIIWDVWDHHATKKKAKPVLRQNIYDYLKEVKESILHDPAYGIMTVIYQMERSISNKVNKIE